MFEFNEDDYLTDDFFNNLIEEEEYKDNEYLRYLIKNQIINGISYRNFKRIWEFINRKSIYDVYDFNFLNLICKNMILMYGDIKEDEVEESDIIIRINKVSSILEHFYKIIDNGFLKKFDSFINIIMGNDKDSREKIKLMIDIVSNFEFYLPLVEDVIKHGKLNYREKYTIIELLKFEPDYYVQEYEYEEYEREFYPDDEIVCNITTLEDLRHFINICYETQISRIKALTEDDFYGEANYMIKNEITKILTNIKYYGRESFDTIGFRTNSLKELRDSIQDDNIKEELSRYILFMSLIDAILKIDDLKKLKTIACRVANFKLNNDTIFTIYDYTKNLEKRIKELYAFEIEEKLFKFDKLREGNYQLYMRINSKFLADSKMLDDEDITGRKVDYIELSGVDYVSFVHVLNAYGDGGKLKDFKTPRIIGKEYICLSAIDETKTNIAKSKKDDEEHVSLLFSEISPDQLLSESFDDLYSYGDINSLSITTDERENFRPIRKQIKLNKGSHTEFVLYRTSSSGKPIYPSGVLIQSSIPTQAEINAAAYLNVPIVYINREKYNKKSTNIETISSNHETYKPSSEDYKIFRQSLIELRDAISGKAKGR